MSGPRGRDGRTQVGACSVERPACWQRRRTGYLPISWPFPCQEIKWRRPHIKPPAHAHDGASLCGPRQLSTGPQQLSLPPPPFPPMPPAPSLSLSPLNPPRPTCFCVSLRNAPSVARAMATAAHGHDDAHHGPYWVNHPYHVLPPSPWPALTGWSVGVACLGECASLGVGFQRVNKGDERRGGAQRSAWMGQQMDI